MATELALQPSAAVAAQPGYAVADASAARRPGGLTAQLSLLPLRRKVTLGAALLALAAIVVALFYLNGRGSYQVLYANLNDKDGGAVIAQLAQMNIPYKFAQGSATILVPADQVHDLRLKLAAAGLPKGSTVGFEVMDNSRFGLTQFQERLNFQRGLEGELVRTITSLSAVQDARVHLALPAQNGFFREQQKPSASVLLMLYPGRVLDRAQIAGIVHLVSSSVPNLNAAAVSVLDQDGTLLSSNPQGPDGQRLNDVQLDFVNRIESVYAQRIRDILEPVLGAGNYRAQVTADFDFSQTQSTSEEYRPNQDSNVAAVRSRHVSASGNGAGAGTQPSGIPGAISNQPPGPVAAPVNGPAQDLHAVAAGSGGAAGRVASSGNSESTTNYELDKTVRVTRGVAGRLVRLSAAVVVNHRAVTGADGEVHYEPIAPEELEKLTALVRESIGFHEERGDTIKVIDAAFRVEKHENVETPVWKSPEVLGFAGRALVPGALVLLALLLLFGFVRPALKLAASSRRLNAVVGDTPVAASAGQLPMVEAPLNDASMEAVRALAKDSPVAVANIVREWVNK